MNRTINIIVPQYHSSYCIDNCKYCGFKKSNKLIARNRLNEEDFKKEIDLLLELGHRTIEFVYASDRYFNPSRIASRIRYVKELGEKRNIPIKIGLNAEPFDYKGYKVLNDAGLDFFVLWMETYDKEKYRFWHGEKTPKGDYQLRYDTYEVAIEAGLTNYGMGVLFGLSDWQRDVDSLITHGKQLESKYGVSPYIFGIPRIKRANCVSINKDFVPVSDENIESAVKQYKEAFPNTMIFYNTREEFELNMRLCKENDLFTIDCGTYPGAYLNPKILENDTEQFHTVQYEREKVIIQLEENNFNPRFEW